MAPTTTTSSTFKPLASPIGKPSTKTGTNNSIRSEHSGYEAPPAKHVPSLTAVMPEAPKNYKDVLAYEDKWIGWDGPVWCKRYGRFENVDDAAKDDGFESAGQVHHQDLGPGHKHCAGCTCQVAPEHHNYVQDIKRRVEPMVASLVALEHQVAKLVHLQGRGTQTGSDDKQAKQTEVMDNHHHEGNERFAMHDDGLSPYSNHQAPHAKSEILVKLEGEIHALQHQMHELVRKDGNAEAFVRMT